jgi:hypothetical protein
MICTGGGISGSITAGTYSSSAISGAGSVAEHAVSRMAVATIHRRMFIVIPQAQSWI